MTLGTILLVWLAVSLFGGPLCGMAMRLHERRRPQVVEDDPVYDDPATDAVESARAAGHAT